MSITDVIIANKAGFLTGVRNLIPYPYYHTTKTVNGITFTDNGDGTITVNGTATGDAQFYFCLDIDASLKPNTTYTLSGCPSGGSASTFRLRAITDYPGDNATHVLDYGVGKSFTTIGTYSHIRILIDVMNGATVNNLTFKPMLELGKLAHDFMPYHFGGAKDADTVDGWNFYSSLSELGLTEATATAESIVNAMADNSMLLHKLSGTATNAPIQFPYNYSTLRVTKLSTSYAVFECIGTGNSLIQYGYYNSGSSNKWSGWSTRFLPLTGGTLSGNVAIHRANHGTFALNNTSFTRNGMKPSEMLYGNFLTYDKDGKNIGGMQNFVYTSGNVATSLVAYQNTTDSNYGLLGIKANTDGTIKPYFYQNGGVDRDVLHTGNSQKVTITANKNTAPSTMEGLWAY